VSAGDGHRALQRGDWPQGLAEQNYFLFARLPRATAAKNQNEISAGFNSDLNAPGIARFSQPSEIGLLQGDAAVGMAGAAPRERSAGRGRMMIDRC
jgi:hypothetical protein